MDRAIDRIDIWTYRWNRDVDVSIRSVNLDVNTTIIIVRTVRYSRRTIAGLFQVKPNQFNRNTYCKLNSLSTDSFNFVWLSRVNLQLYVRWKRVLIARTRDRWLELLQSSGNDKLRAERWLRGQHDGLRPTTDTESGRRRSTGHTLRQCDWSITHRCSPR